MKINDILEDLSKRYSFNLFAYSSLLFVFELLLYIIIFVAFDIIATNLYDPEGWVVIIFLLLFFVPTFFLSSLIIKIVFAIKWYIKEQHNPQYRINSKFVSNKLYKYFIFLLFLISLVISCYCIFTSIIFCIGIPTNAFLILNYYFLFIPIFIIYLLLTKSAKSIKLDFLFYIFYCLCALIVMFFFYNLVNYS